MRIEGKRRRRSALGLTSLIDVIFLLLLFFMLSSTFSRYSQLDLGVAGAGKGAGATPKLIIRVSQDEQIVANGRPVSLEDLAEVIEGYVEKGVSNAVVVPRGEVELQHLVVTLEKLKKTELKSVALAN